MKKIYLVDSENVGDVWVPLLVSSQPEDEVLVFYTQKSPHMSYEHVRMLKETEKEAVFIKCFEGNNALDFQLVTELGYMLRENAECEYVIVTNDTGFDAVVRYWTAKKMSVSRLSGKECYRQVNGRGRRRDNFPSAEEKHVRTDTEEQTVSVGQQESPEQPAAAGTGEQENALAAESEEERRPAAAETGEQENTAAAETGKQENAAADEPGEAVLSAGTQGREQSAASETKEAEAAAIADSERRKDSERERAETCLPEPERDAEEMHSPEEAEDACLHDAQTPEKEGAQEADAKNEAQEQDGNSGDRPEGSCIPDEVRGVVSTLFRCISKDHLADFHNALVMFFGEETGKELYQEIKGNPEWTMEWTGAPYSSQKEKFDVYCKMVFEHSELADSQPQDFSSFLLKSGGKRKNLNSLRAALQGQYGKDKGMKYYSLFKSHIKIMNRM